MNIQGWFPLGWTDSCLENSMNSMKREVSRKSFSICQARHELKTCLFNNPSPPIHIQRKEREKGRKGGREKDGEIPNHLGEHSVQFSSVAQSCLTLCDPVDCQASLSIANSWSLLKLISIESVIHPTISSSVVPSPLAFILSQHQGLFQ